MPVSYSEYIGRYNVFFSQGSLKEQNVYSFQQERSMDGLAELRTIKGNLPATQKLIVRHQCFWSLVLSLWEGRVLIFLPLHKLLKMWKIIFTQSCSRSQTQLNWRLNRLCIAFFQYVLVTYQNDPWCLPEQMIVKTECRKLACSENDRARQWSGEEITTWTVLRDCKHRVTVTQRLKDNKHAKNRGNT